MERKQTPKMTDPLSESPGKGRRGDSGNSSEGFKTRSVMEHVQWRRMNNVEKD